MRIISRRTLRQFWEKHPDAEQPLRSWFQLARKSEWTSFNRIKADLPRASIMSGERVVFDIKGNSYRLVVLIKFSQRKMFIRFIGTHAEYDKINAESI